MIYMLPVETKQVKTRKFSFGKFKVSSYKLSGLGNPESISWEIAKWRESGFLEGEDGFPKDMFRGGMGEVPTRPISSCIIIDEEKINSLPVWLQILNRCLMRIDGPVVQTDACRDKQLIIPDSPLPFEEVLVPFVCYAREKLREKLREEELITESAQIQLERSLLSWLAYLNSFALEQEFSLFRSVHQSGLRRKLKQKETDMSKTKYKAFVQHLFEDRLTHYFNEYPVPARLIGTAIEQWINCMEELIRRFKKDKSLIADTFNNGSDPGKKSTEG